jgi:hypothetical protein
MQKIIEAIKLQAGERNSPGYSWRSADGRENADGAGEVYLVECFCGMNICEESRWRCCQDCLNTPPW